MPRGMSTEASMTARWYSMSIIMVCNVIPAKLRMIPVGNEVARMCRQLDGRLHGVQTTYQSRRWVWPLSSLPQR